MHAFAKLTFVQFKLFLREPLAFFFTLVFPVLLLLLYGVIWGNEPGSAFFGGPYGYIDTEVPALAAIIIGTVAFMSIPIATASARERKELRRLRASPLRPTTYFAADVVVYLSICTLAVILLIVIGRLAFDLRFAGNWLALLAGFLLCALAFVAFGYLIASVAPNSRAAQVVGQVLFFPMMFLSGATLPLFIMPEGVQNVAEKLPLTYVVTLLQGLWFGQGWNSTAVLVMAGMLGMGALISARTFRWE